MEPLEVDHSSNDTSFAGSTSGCSDTSCPSPQRAGLRRRRRTSCLSLPVDAAKGLIKSGSMIMGDAARKAASVDNRFIKALPEPSQSSSLINSFTSFTASLPLVEDEPGTDLKPTVRSNAVKEGVGSLFAAWSSLVMTCLGSSMLNIPYIFASCGGFLGFVVLCIPVWFSASSMRALVRLADASGQNDFGSAMLRFLGAKGDNAAFVLLTIILMLVGSMCISIVVELIMLQLPPLKSHREIVTAGMVALLLPLTPCKSLSALQSLSIVQFLILGYVGVLLVSMSIANGNIHKNTAAVVISPKMLIALGQAMSGFGAELTVITSYRETPMDDRPLFERWVIDGSLLSLMVLYTIVALAGYACYGSKVHSNVLKSFENNRWTDAAKYGAVVANFVRLPMFAILIFVVTGSRFPGILQGKEDSSRMRVLFGTAYLIICAALYLGLSKLGIILAITGATCGAGLNSVLPALAWYSARKTGDVEGSLFLDVTMAVQGVFCPIFTFVFLVELVGEWNNL